jgi:type I restriction enzyme M protein
MAVDTAQKLPSIVTVGSVPDGKVADYLTGKHVRDTPEEYVRQNIEKALTRQYKYPVKDCAPEFTMKVGSSKRRADIVVFNHDSEHVQANAYIVVETKKAEVKASSKTEGVEQLWSYMAACLNVRYGMWTNGDDRFCETSKHKGRLGL